MSKRPPFRLHLTQQHLTFFFIKMIGSVKKKKPKADLSIRSDHWARTSTGQGEPSSAGDFSPFAGHRGGGGGPM